MPQKRKPTADPALKPVASEVLNHFAPDGSLSVGVCGEHDSDDTGAGIRWHYGVAALTRHSERKVAAIVMRAGRVLSVLLSLHAR